MDEGPVKLKAELNIKRREAADVDIGQSASPLAQRVYAARDVLSDAELDYSLAKLSPPSQMKGLSEAAHLLYQHIQRGSNIMIVGDFDCDGATSSALGVLGLRTFGAVNVEYLVPNRFDYGYGLTPEIVKLAQHQSPDLLITVDNGISSIEGVEAAKANGWDVIVTDHHLPGRTLPAADAIVNPNQPGCSFPSKSLAGVGVMFYLLIALRGVFRREQPDSKAAQVNIAQWLDIVALGTVADVVPLDHNNRILVAQGLHRINAGQCRPGISALLSVAKRYPGHLQASDLGFAVGPRLNAAGRLDDISVGIQCLLTSSDSTAMHLANDLDALNKARREIEAGMQQEAMSFLAKYQRDDLELPWGLCIYDAQWHQGVVGILASRLKERFHRPVIAFAEESATHIKGSGRSIPGLHLRDVLDEMASKSPGLISKFGGHSMAAGLSLEKSAYAEFSKLFDQVVRNHLTADQLDQIYWTDGALNVSEYSIATAYELERLGPFGQKFPEPIFDGEFFVYQQRILGERHLKLSLAPVDAPQTVIEAIAFNVVDEHGVGLANHTQKIRAVFKLSVNRFRGNESVQLVVDALEAC